MKNYYKRTLIDITILSRISEEEVQAWLVAKLSKLRETGMNIHSIEAKASHRAGEVYTDVEKKSDPHFDYNTMVFAKQKELICANGEDIKMAMHELLEKLL